MSLDEMSEDRLQRELDRRKELRAKGLCDYCERPPQSTPCRFPQRHIASTLTGKMVVTDDPAVAAEVLKRGGGAGLDLTKSKPGVESGWAPYCTVWGETGEPCTDPKCVICSVERARRAGSASVRET